MWGTETGMGWWMVLGSVWFVAFWALVIWAVVKLSGGERAGGDHREQSRPIEIAQRRYASGEITKEQFEELKRNLSV